jgi:hypothetical protein
MRRTETKRNISDAQRRLKLCTIHHLGNAKFCSDKLRKRVNLGLCLIKHNEMKPYGVVKLSTDAQIHAICCITAADTSTRDSLDRRLGGPYSRSRRIAYCCWESNLDRPASSPSLYRLSYPGYLHKFEYHVK